MFFRQLVLKLGLFLLLAISVEGSPQQRIKDFYLSHYKEDGLREWEVSGEEAIIYENQVNIDKMKANYYTPRDIITVQSEKARLDKENMNFYLRDNVQIENKEGVKLVTNSLDWKKEANLVETNDWVEVTNDSTRIKAKGLTADTQFKSVDFRQDVEVKLPDKEGESTVITCRGPLEIEYNEGRVILNDNVVMEHKEGKLFSDKATVFFDSKERKIIKVVSEGHVKMVREGNITFAEKATYLRKEGKVVLEGNPRLIYFP